MGRKENAAAPPTAPTEKFLPARWNLAALRKAAATCRGCELYAKATQTVFGEGLVSSSIMLVGEQPGDQEDRQGKPFVGPAGRILQRALEEAGIEPRATYVTNAVKHFDFEPRGKARIHQKPKYGDVRACRPWLVAEVEVIQPDVLVLLGATAAQSVLGREFRVTKRRGTPISTALGPPAVATWHPSNVLRAPDSEARERYFRELVEDLKTARATGRRLRHSAPAAQ